MEDFQICPLSTYYKRILIPVSYSLVFLLGLSLNGVLLWCVICRTRRWSNTVIYLTNLAVADLLFVLALPPLIISDAMGNFWPFGNIFCKTVRFVFLVNLHCSIMFVTCVSVHRFIGVCYPIAAVRLRTRKFAILASGSIWILANAEISPTFVFAHTGVINNMTVCFEMTGPKQFDMFFPYGLFLVIAGFLIPFLVVVTCYCSMIKVLYCGAADSISNTRKQRVRKKCLYTLLTVCLMFAVCFVPYHIVRTVYMFVRVYMPGNCHLLNLAMITFKVWKPVVVLNCCVNPLIYFCSSHPKRLKFTAWLWRRNKRVEPTVCLVSKRCEGYNP
nr:PREDICTED: P2Y purinoceptor 3-like [Pundamilia nyererei]